MYSKQNEIEVIVESLIDECILETFADYFSTKKECEYAFEVLKNKLDELDATVFDSIFD
jgi:hypothetical protein